MKKELLSYTMARDIFAILYDRKGFDDWWDDIERSTQKEICLEIQDYIQKELNKLKNLGDNNDYKNF